MNGKHKPMWKVISILSLLSSLATPQMIMAAQNMNHQTVLSEIVPAIVQIMGKNGYEMPDYRVLDGHTDVPVSGPPEKYAFFGYVDKGWLKSEQKIVLNFYEADKLPIAGRTQLINYLLKVYDEKKGAFAISLYMTKDKYKKPQLIMPDAFLEMNLYQISR